MTRAATVLVGRRESFSAAHELCDPRLAQRQDLTRLGTGLQLPGGQDPARATPTPRLRAPAAFRSSSRPTPANAKRSRPGWDGGLYSFMRRVLDTVFGGRLYAMRQGMIQAGLRPLPA